MLQGSSGTRWEEPVLNSCKLRRYANLYNVVVVRSMCNDYPDQNHIKNCVHANAGFWMATNIELECPGISATDG